MSEIPGPSPEDLESARKLIGDDSVPEDENTEPPVEELASEVYPQEVPHMFIEGVPPESTSLAIDAIPVRFEASTEGEIERHPGTEVIDRYVKGDGTLVELAVIWQPEVTEYEDEHGEVHRLEFRFVSPEELAHYRESTITDGFPYQVAIGSLAFGSKGNIGLITNITDQHQPEGPKTRKSPKVTLTFPDGSTERRALVNLVVVQNYKPDSALGTELAEHYQDRVAFQQGSTVIRLGDRVIVNNHFNGTVQAILPQEAQPPQVAVLATERHYYPKGNDTALKAGESHIFLKVAASQVILAPPPRVFTSPLRVLDEAQ
jgi:hypothetical protein